jgi:hypothetical protein
MTGKNSLSLSLSLSLLLLGILGCSVTSSQAPKTVTREEKARALEVIEKAKQDFYAIVEAKVQVKYRTNAISPSIGKGQLTYTTTDTITIYHEGYQVMEFITNDIFVLTNDDGEEINTNVSITNQVFVTNTYEMTPLEAIEAFGMMEITGGKTNALSDYLKEVGIYDDATNILARPEVKEAIQILEAPLAADPQSSDTNTNITIVYSTYANTLPPHVPYSPREKDFYFSLQAGDILLSIGGSGSTSSGSFSGSSSPIGLVIPGTWKHAGMIVPNARNSDWPHWVIYSASDKTYEKQYDNPSNYLASVGFESIEQWQKELYVSAYRVLGKTETHGKSAFDSVIHFRGFPYSMMKWDYGIRWHEIGIWLFDFKRWRWTYHVVARIPVPYAVYRSVRRDENDCWYCTKVVYRAWLAQGVNIEHSKGRWDPFVSPDDIRNAMSDGTLVWILGSDDPFYPVR